MGERIQETTICATPVSQGNLRGGAFLCGPSARVEASSARAEASRAARALEVALEEAALDALGLLQVVFLDPALVGRERRLEVGLGREDPEVRFREQIGVDLVDERRHGAATTGAARRRAAF